MNHNEIQQNIADVRTRLALCGRGDAGLLLATKTVDCDDIAFAVRECGVKYIGENRVQELLEKYDRLKDLPCEIHFIGTLQKNKVKYIIDKVSLIHSVGSAELAAEINRQAEKRGIIMNILVEVNIGREPEKTGFSPEETPAAFDEMLSFPNIRPLGLMTMAPAGSTDDEYRKYFTKTYRIFIDNCIEKIDNRYRPVLSMGMSDSFEAAAGCGATLVRVGSAVFGKRK